MPTLQGPVLVVGATRILAPAARALVREGRDVLAVARNAAGLAALRADLGPRIRPLSADAREATFPHLLVEALCSNEPEEPTLGAALLYGPAVSAETVEMVAKLADGPVVLVLTSRAAVPTAGRWLVADLPPAPIGVRRVVLGWRADGTWHEPAEVSAAAVCLLGDELGRDTVLGSLRPWAERAG